MAKSIYLVRHCEAKGQPAESPLTEKGLLQAKDLSEFFYNIEIDCIISSPYLRAIQSAETISENKNIKIEIDKRLKERVLSIINLPDWFDKLKETFKDMNLKFEGGESSNEAMNRIVNVIHEVLKGESENIIIVTHGNIMSLLLRNYNNHFDFDCWKKLSNPDVFLIEFSDYKVNIERAWNRD
jgi:2,3-bisphosphoglycerate-dependent phosphoglycerate mutase